MKWFSIFKKNLEDFVVKLENKNISIFNYYLMFFFIIELRFFFESYSTNKNYLNFPIEKFTWIMLHYNLAFVVLALIFIGIFYNATKTSIEKNTRVVLSSFILILLAPILDLLSTHGRGAATFYLAPGLNINVLWAYLSYFIYGGFLGASFGIKCEVIVALSGCFIYFCIKKCSIARSLIYTWICYSCIFLWASSPFFIKWFLEVTKIDDDFFHHYDNTMMSYFYLLIILIISLWIFYLNNKKIFVSKIKEALPFRAFYYVTIFLLGISLAWAQTKESIIIQILVQPNVLIDTVLITISILFSCGFSAVMNKIGGLNEVNISTNSKNDIYTGCFYLSLAFFYAAIVGIKALLIIFVLNGTYYLYYIFPMRLKRIIILSDCVLPLNSMALTVLAYLVVFDSLYLFPPELFWIFAAEYLLLGCLSLLIYFNQKTRRKLETQGLS